MKENKFFINQIKINHEIYQNNTINTVLYYKLNGIVIVLEKNARDKWLVKGNPRKRNTAIHSIHDK